MTDLPKENRIRELIGEVGNRMSVLNNGYVGPILEVLERVVGVLDTPASKRNQVVLLLSVATRHMKRVEGLVIDAILGKEWISQQDEAVFVRVRIHCYEIIGLLTSASDDLRLVPVPVERYF
jgi:hypothetical protein